ncbi:hypothetical protein TELCIR_13750 [Teladorsagia circumcincta]|uniref:CHK kinase-like domain-containing protein n=1 Tax=Teladorsagia circumcincta TaxID=45464 RepID=A0A2G9U2Z1_TELCI|nr:hypothetical protein TELCIR_13750 [Teladorsagia circumcincta]
MEDIISMLRSHNAGKFARNADQLKAIVPDMINFKWADNLGYKFGVQRVLCHGDICPTNTFWKQTGGNIELAAVIDYQTAHFGCSATDLVQIFVTFLSGKDRRAHWEQLIEDFYGYLKQEVGNRRVPYILDQLKDAYLQFFPTGAFTLIPYIAPLFEIIPKNVHEEQKRKEYLEMVTEKMEYLLEDLLHCHDRNVKIRDKKTAA